MGKHTQGENSKICEIFKFLEYMAGLGHEDYIVENVHVGDSGVSVVGDISGLCPNPVLGIDFGPSPSMKK